MRAASVGGFIGISIAVAAFTFCGQAQAQSGTVKATFEKHGLLGTFSRHCSRPAAPDNLYFVNRLLDADHVQRDAMEGPTTRPWYLLIRQGRSDATKSGSAAA